jgi:hydrogenase maturation protein HypF
VAAKFHNTVAGFCLEAARHISGARGVRAVALAGGVFQNRLLLRHLVSLLEEDGFDVLLPREAPINDGGVSLGQAIVASARMANGCL